MKRNDLLKYLRSQGCGFAIHGGEIQVKTNDHQYRDILKSTTISQGKYVKTLE